jgi:polyisoprenyl-phosphate glycosyltransferase
LSIGESVSQPAHVDVVVPVYNEEEALPAFHQKLREIIDPLPYEFTIYYINDGSIDRTQAVLEELLQKDARIVTLELSRNFGHQAALTAGLDRANGDFVITMDGDGEHPAGLIPEMLRLAQMGYDIVLTEREEKNSTSIFKRWTSATFYRLINRMGDTRILPGGADFRLMNHATVSTLRSMREYHRFLRGMVAWMGFHTVILPYLQPERLGGRSKYSFRKMVSLAANAIFSFSLMPLYFSISLGGLFLVLALIEAVYVLSFWISGNTSSLAPGWSSLMFVLLTVGGTLMISVGFIGIYIGYIFQETKQRPVYIVRQQLGRPIQDEAELLSRHDR